MPSWSSHPCLRPYSCTGCPDLDFFSTLWPCHCLLTQVLTHLNPRLPSHPHLCLQGIALGGALSAQAWEEKGHFKSSGKSGFRTMTQVSHPGPVPLLCCPLFSFPRQSKVSLPGQGVSLLLESSHSPQTLEDSGAGTSRILQVASGAFQHGPTWLR